MGADDAVDRKAIDSLRVMTLQSHATPEVLERTGVVSPAPNEFDPFADWAAMLDGAVKKGNLSIGEHRSLEVGSEAVPGDTADLMAGRGTVYAAYDVLGAADSGIIKEGVA